MKARGRWPVCPFSPLYHRCSALFTFTGSLLLFGVPPEIPVRTILASTFHALTFGTLYLLVNSYPCRSTSYLLLDSPIPIWPYHYFRHLILSSNLGQYYVAHVH